MVLFSKITQTNEVTQKQLNMLIELKLLMSFLAALVNNLKMSIFINIFSKVQNDSIKSIYCLTWHCM